MSAWKTYIPYVAGLLVFFALLYGYAVELQRFQRSFEPGQMVLLSALVGLVPGFFLGRYLSRGIFDLTERVKMYLLAFSFCVLFAPLFGAWGNRWLSPHPERIESVYFVAESPFQGFRFGNTDANRQANSYHCFFIYDESLRRILVPSPIAGNLNKGDSLPIRLRKGLFGVEWVILPPASKN